MTAQHAGGWGDRGDDRHWSGADRRPACDPHAPQLEVDVDAALRKNPWSQARTCPGCDDVVEDLRNRAATLGFRVEPLRRSATWYRSLYGGIPDSASGTEV